MAAGLPVLNPFKNTDAIFKHGANFAVAGPTALPIEILADKNISSLVTGNSVSVQLDCMFTHFNSICYDDRGCVEKLKNSLFVVGEIGGNDYNYAPFQGKSMEEVKSMVSDIVEAIMDAVRVYEFCRLAQYGAVRVVVPRNFPGCFPIYLTGFKTNDSTAYDENHCLKALNNVLMYHNDHLQKAIEDLKQEYPNAIIVYGDHYNAFQWLLHNAPKLGFDNTLQKGCCGIGGDYNFSLTRMCGAPEVPVCPEPNRLVSWDGVHLTEEGYKVMAGKLIDDILPQLQCVA
ncbi:GDSL esterase/lipase At5g03980-like [Cornus florida]|uniref:GDSL esterase/lipase At5g03980-like n=1 Tax=Cornus florida TaxID=4283 RepID=UPI00289C565D|nr:GDSL esterase/lipase At5g03980-like [Cornus florida]